MHSLEISELSGVTPQVEELRGIAVALRQLPHQQANDVYLESMAGKYLRKALQIGAFGHPKWIHFRTDAEHWHTRDFLVSASDWFMKHGTNLGLQVDAEKGNGGLAYWAPFVADMIDEHATAIWAHEQAAREAAARAPINRWKAIHHWWQHNLYATIAVVVVGVISGVGGLFAFAREIFALFEIGR